MGGRVNLPNVLPTVHSDVQVPSIERPEMSLVAKTQKVAFAVLFWVVWGLAAALSCAAIIPAAVVIYKRHQSRSMLKRAIQELAVLRHKYVWEAVEKIPGYEVLNKGGAYALEVHRFIKLLKSKRALKGDVHQHMQKVRCMLDGLIAHPFYQRNKLDRSDVAIRVVQAAAHGFVARSAGVEPLERLGADASGELPEALELKELSSCMRRVVGQQRLFTKNSVIAKVFWALCHPSKAFMACKDAAGIEPAVRYNSYEHGNAAIQIGAFGVNGVNFSLSQAPSFTCDRLVEAARDRGDKRIFQDIEAEEGPQAERKRVEAKRAVHQELSESAGAIYHLHTPIDVHRKKKAQTFGLSDKLTQNAEEALKGNEAAKAILFASVRGLQVMVEQSKRFVSGDTIYLNQSCKQNIDRGLAVNIATIILADKVGQKPITQKRANQLIGMLVARPGIVDDRAILKSRLDPLLDVLDALQECPELMKAVCQELPEDICFEIKNPGPAYESRLADSPSVNPLREGSSKFQAS